MSPPKAMVLAVVIVAVGLFASIRLGSADGAYGWQAVGGPGLTPVSAGQLTHR